MDVEEPSGVRSEDRVLEDVLKMPTGSRVVSPNTAPNAARSIEGENSTHLGAFQHDFTSPELAELRKRYFAIVLRALGLVILLTWATLPIYWGAVANSTKLTHNLDAWFIDRDGSRIGHAMWNTIGNTSTPGLHLGWNYIDQDLAGSDEDIQQAIISEQAWIAVVVSANATLELQYARESGNASYDPTTAITVYYSQARDVTTTGSYVIPIATALLQQATTVYATNTAQLYLAQIYAQGTVNVTALQRLAQAPRTISTAVGWTVVNLRPYTAPVAIAVTLVGNIFLCIFAFIMCMAHATARSLIERHLRLPSYLAMRVVVPLLVYFPLSLSYSLVSLAFDLPFGARYNPAAGFFLFFVFVYMGMASLGLALESMITLMTPRFVPFFLFLLIIVNVAVASLPNDLQTPIYLYGVGFPIWNLAQAIRTIIFNTHSYLGRNAGVLLAWILLSCFSLSLFTWFVRWQDKRRLNVQQVEWGVIKTGRKSKD